MFWRTQFDEVIDGYKRMGRGFRICCRSSQQAADVGIPGTFIFATIISSCLFSSSSLAPLLLQASSPVFIKSFYFTLKE